MNIDFRPAEAEEAEELTEIIRETSGGLADFSLQGIIPLVSPKKLLCFQVMDEDSPYHHENIVVAASSERIEGMILAYDWRDQKLSDMAKRYMRKDRFNVLKDLLESTEPDSLYINTLWVSPTYRGTGMADAFIDLAQQWALESGLKCLSLHVWESNERARKFYHRHGFAQTKRFTIPPHKLLQRDGGKLQMVKVLA